MRTGLMVCLRCGAIHKEGCWCLHCFNKLNLSNWGHSIAMSDWAPEPLWSLAPLPIKIIYWVKRLLRQVCFYFLLRGI